MKLTRFAALMTLISVSSVLSAESGANEIAPLRVEPAVSASDADRGVYSDRSLTLAIEVDRDAGRLVLYTVKERPFIAPVEPVAPRHYEESSPLQLEVVLLDDYGNRHTQRIDIGPICFLHGGDTQPHAAGDKDIPHRSSFLVRVPEIPGFNRLEIAYYEQDAASNRRLLGIEHLDAARFIPTGAALASRRRTTGVRDNRGEQLPAPPSPLLPPAGPAPEQLVWPENCDPVHDVSRHVLIQGDEDEIEERINIVIVPDGYSCTELQEMEDDAAVLVNGIRTRSPFMEHDDFFNYFLIRAFSVDSGADRCDTTPVQQKNTAIGTYWLNPQNEWPWPIPHYGPGNSYSPRCDTLYSYNPNNILYAEFEAPALDETVIMTNHGVVDIGRIQYERVLTPDAWPLVLSHELGHALAGLGDEYSIRACHNPHSAGEINTSNSSAGAWPEFVPTYYGGTCTDSCLSSKPLLGAETFIDCKYRPTSMCRMNLTGGPFCPVCLQQWALTIFGHPNVAPTAPVASFSPESPQLLPLRTEQTFSLSTRFASQQLDNTITWTLMIPGEAPLVVPSNLPDFTYVFRDPGHYTLVAEVVADTNWVKKEDLRNHDGVVWQICVGDPLVDWCSCVQCVTRFCDSNCNTGIICTDVEDLGVQCCDQCGSDPPGTPCPDYLQCGPGQTVHRQQCPCGPGSGPCPSTSATSYVCK